MRILIFLGFSLALVSAACGKKTEVPEITKPVMVPPIETTPPAAAFTYLALGDSYTIGQSVEAYQNFPNQLINQLKDANFSVNGKIIAQTGWTTTNLIQAIKAETLAPKYDFVTLLIGVNNQYQRGNIDTYRKEFIELLQTSIRYAGGDVKRVFVLSIPDYSVTPFVGNDVNITSRIAREIDAYNQINKEETAKLKANYLDITPISRKAKDDRSLLAGDGLHPSATMYQAWVSLLKPMVANRLK